MPVSTPARPQKPKSDEGLPRLAPGRTVLGRISQSALGIAIVGSLLMFAAQPPLDLWPLAWIAPIPWLLLVRGQSLPGKRPYRSLWAAGLVYWLLAVHWLRLPHWTTHFGWLALSFYLAFYLPVFVAVSRTAVHRMRMPLTLAAPLVWTGLELARGYVMTGFLMGALGHTQYRWVQLIQISDLTGGYGVDFLVMFVAAGFASMWPTSGRRPAVWPLVPLMAVLAGVLAYGHFRTSGDYTLPGPKVALIQGSIESQIKADPSHAETVLRHYFDLSLKAVRQTQDLDLMVWPETMFRGSLIYFEDNVVPRDEGMTPEELKENLRANDENSRQAIAELARRLDVSLLLGVDIFHFWEDQRASFNSAVFTDRQGKLLGRYDKMHRVVFGEFVPFGDSLPWLYDVTPLTGGIRAGDGPECVEIAGATFSPNICYETVIPHTIRGHVVELRRQGREPDVLVNLTNDGWFRGSSELDQHLACGVLRAVECRKPLLIAANTGFSAWIDSDGRVIEQGPRRAEGIIIADVQLDTRDSLYMRWGDWFAGLCLAGTVAVAGFGLFRRRFEALQ